MPDFSWERCQRIQKLNAWVIGLYVLAPLPFIIVSLVTGDAMAEAMERRPENGDSPSPLPFFGCCPSFLVVVVQFVLAVKAIAPLKELRPDRYRTVIALLALTGLFCQNGGAAVVPLLATQGEFEREAAGLILAMCTVGFLVPIATYCTIHYGFLWPYYSRVWAQRKQPQESQLREHEAMEDKEQMETAFKDARGVLRHQVQLSLDHECENACEAKLPNDALQERIKGLVLNARQLLCEQEELLLAEYMAKPTFAAGKPSLDRQLLELREELLSVQSIRQEVQRQLQST